MPPMISLPAYAATSAADAVMTAGFVAHARLIDESFKSAVGPYSDCYVRDATHFSGAFSYTNPSSLRFPSLERIVRSFAGSREAEVAPPSLQTNLHASSAFATGLG